MPKTSLSGKIALVTGASRGIGASILKQLASEAATVIGTATTPEGADKITAFIKENNFSGQGMVLDVTDAKARDQVIQAIKENFGSIHILVNNAALTADNLFLRMKAVEWQSVIDTDLSAVFYLSKLVLRDMLKSRAGRIINIGSVVGNTGNPGQVNYCAAKAGLIGMTKALALEVGTRNITVNVVAPGYVVTDMTRVLSDEQRAAILAQIPMGRPATVEDIASAVLFLASDAAGYITGQTLHVNGGMFMN